MGSLAIRIPLRARVLAACFGVLVSCLLAADLAGAYGVRVEALSPNGARTVDSVDLDLAGLSGSEDVRGRDYTVRYASGQQETETVTGFSLLRILEEARDRRLDIDPGSFRQLTVMSQGGSHTVLESDAGGNQNGPPVLYEYESETVFLRPAEDTDDANGEDRLVAPDKLVLKVHPREDPGPPEASANLAVSALEDGQKVILDTSDPPVEVETGTRVFFAGALDGGPGGKLNYSWSFGNGRTDTGQRVSHGFEDRGLFTVRLEVSTSGGDVFSDSLAFQVGEPTEGPGGDGGDGDEGSFEAGLSDSGDSGDYVAPSYTAPSVPYIPPADDYDSPSGDSGLGGASGGKPPRSPGPPSGRGPDSEAGSEATGGEQITGELLSPVAPSIAGDVEAADSAEPGTAGTADSDGGGIPGAAVGGLAVLSLLGVGALGELGRLRPVSNPLPRVREILGR